jgi:WD40 repeat protein
MENILISGSKDSKIRLWNTNKGNVLLKLSGHNKPILSLSSFNNKQKTFLTSGCEEGIIKLWEITPNSGNADYLVSSFSHLDNKPVRCISSTKDGKKLFSGGDGGSIYLWDVDSFSLSYNQCLRVIKLAHSGSITSMLWDDFNQCLITGGSDNEIGLIFFYFFLFLIFFFFLIYRNLGYEN